MLTFSLSLEAVVKLKKGRKLSRWKAEEEEEERERERGERKSYLSKTADRSSLLQGYPPPLSLRHSRRRRREDLKNYFFFYFFLDQEGLNLKYERLLLRGGLSTVDW